MVATSISGVTKPGPTQAWALASTTELGEKEI